MSPQEVYDWLSKTFPTEQWEYYAVVFGALVAIATFYREVLKGVFLQVYEWFINIKTSFTQTQMIPNIKERLDVIEKNQEANKIIFNNALEELKRKSGVIEAELSVNSGKSLKDIILRVASGMDNVEKVTTSLDFQVKRIEARQWNIMINSSDIPIFEADTRGLFLKTNKAFLDLVGMAQDEVQDNGWVNVIFLDDRKLVQSEWESAIEDKRSFDLKYKIQNNRTNRVFSVRCVAQPVSVEKEIVGYIGRYINVQEMVQDQKTNFWVIKT